ncbi:hypothetical protein Mp_4g05630 [Marchantia polymorpha subsp. ruderalis]|uniref:Uncharacterized protein n=2 Tax=Marchantia polymorpha TaxID=3197 RepID=A0AAF6B6Q2_MARPO|nr:hypothetical protein MARPO_0087s0028 [Marchantia polymorpha]BBN07686.1 hypothetical protein Mp_4g05630 [Marchantia polymorpha subsp. ruderalis]|eukprot:PTQ33587.1 hypothetical protein MARPO_0087s0028 [Marchantia polymorpha]
MGASIHATAMNTSSPDLIRKTKYSFEEKLSSSFIQQSTRIFSLTGHRLPQATHQPTEDDEDRMVHHIYIA